MKKSINYLPSIILLSFISVNIVYATGIIKIFNTPHKNIDSVEFLKDLEENTTPNFDKIIACSNYTYKTDGVVYSSAFGCFYNPKANNYGHVSIFLIPNKGIKAHLEKINSLFVGGNIDYKAAKESTRINDMNIQEIKKEFNIYISLMDKKYEQYTSNPKDYNYPSFTTYWYTFSTKKEAWLVVDSFNTEEGINMINQVKNWQQEKLDALIKFETK